MEKVVGQVEGVQYLRLVIEGRLSSPLLLVGPNGVGKRFSVTEAIKEILNEGPDCSQCYQVDRGIHPDVRMIGYEGDSDIKVEDLRMLISAVETKPSRAPWKFLVVDGADRMTSASSNALLKVLEEPPSFVRFFLLAESLHNVLPTIRSRCVEVRYRKLPEAFVTHRLQELTDQPSKALVCCRLAGGSLGQAAMFLGSGRLELRNRMFGLLKVGLSGDLSDLFRTIDAVTDLPLGLLFLEHLVHDLVMLPHDPSRLTNVDLVTELGEVRLRMGEAKITRLRSSLSSVLSLVRGPYNLSFHTKAALAAAFS